MSYEDHTQRTTARWWAMCLRRQDNYTIEREKLKERWLNLKQESRTDKERQRREDITTHSYITLEHTTDDLNYLFCFFSRVFFNFVQCRNKQRERGKIEKKKESNFLRQKVVIEENLKDNEEKRGNTRNEKWSTRETRGQCALIVIILRDLALSHRWCECSRDDLFSAHMKMSQV